MGAGSALSRTASSFNSSCTRTRSGPCRTWTSEKVTVAPAELQLALQLIDQISQDTFDPTQFEDEKKQRVPAAIDEKIAGKQIVAPAHNEDAATGQVIDLMDGLKASLGSKAATSAT